MNLKKVVVYECSGCSRRYADEEHADKCCEERECQDCNKMSVFNVFLDRCDDCRMKFEKHNITCLLESAEEVDKQYHKGMIYTNEVNNCRDGYFDNIDDLVDYCACCNISVPNEVFCCSQTVFKIDLFTIIEDIEENMGFEDGQVYVGIKELEEAVKAFNKANEDVVVYHEDYTKKIVVGNETKIKI